MRDDHRIDIHHLTQCHRQVYERVAQMAVVRSREARERPLFAEHRIDQKRRAGVVDLDRCTANELKLNASMLH